MGKETKLIPGFTRAKKNGYLPLFNLKKSKTGLILPKWTGNLSEYL
jgi:hypothetical protein